MAREVSRGPRAEAVAVALALSALLVWGCLFREAPPESPSVPHLDKWKHAAAHAVLAAAWTRALARSGAGADRAALAAFAIGVLLGGALEVVQPRFGRNCDLVDEAANALGAAVGALAYRAALTARPALLARLLSPILGAGASLALALGAQGCETPGPKKVTVITIPGRSAGIEPGSAGQAQAPSIEDDTPTHETGSVPLAPDEDARLIEQAGIVRLSDPALARDFYAALEGRVRPADRPFFRWLRARIAPSRDERRRALAEVAGYSVRLHGALLDAGDMAFEEGRPDDARAAWDEALSLDRRSPRALARRAVDGSGRPRVESAMTAVRALEAPPEGGGAAAKPRERVPDPFVARALAAVGRRGRAREMLLRCEAEGFSPSIAARFLGDLALEAGDTDAASRAYERALVSAPAALVPEAVYARVTLPRIARLAALGKALAAEEIALAAAAREGPPSPPLFGYVSAVLAELCGDTAHARERASAARDRDIDGAPCGRALALALARLGRCDLAGRLRADLERERP